MSWSCFGKPCEGWSRRGKFCKTGELGKGMIDLLIRVLRDTRIVQIGYIPKASPGPRGGRVGKTDQTCNRLPTDLHNIRYWILPLGTMKSGGERNQAKLTNSPFESRSIVIRVNAEVLPLYCLAWRVKAPWLALIASFRISADRISIVHANPQVPVPGPAAMK